MGENLQGCGAKGFGRENSLLINTGVRVHVRKFLFQGKAIQGGKVPIKVYDCTRGMWGGMVGQRVGWEENPREIGSKGHGH